jgi:hypothetical protein
MFSLRSSFRALRGGEGRRKEKRPGFKPIRDPFVVLVSLKAELVFAYPAVRLGVEHVRCRM